MFYQKLLSGKDPYLCSLGKGSSNGFGMHFHHELELSYCARGDYGLRVVGQELKLHPGELAIVNSMVVHESLPRTDPNCMNLTVEIGPGFLGDYFETLVKQCGDCRVLKLNTDDSGSILAQLHTVLREIVQIRLNPSVFGEMVLKGNLYKLSGLLLECFSENQETFEKNLRDIRFVEKALEIIYNRYNEPLDLEAVSLECGYGKSNFCKIFKQNTGETFHNLLNRHRIDVACTLLEDQTLSVEQIAFSVGFSDTTSFCRVFKNIMGESAGSYKKRLNSH